MNIKVIRQVVLFYEHCSTERGDFFLLIFQYSDRRFYL
jgi:hypothetical protein